MRIHFLTHRLIQDLSQSKTSVLSQESGITISNGTESNQPPRSIPPHEPRFADYRREQDVNAHSKLSQNQPTASASEKMGVKSGGVEQAQLSIAKEMEDQWMQDVRTRGQLKRILGVPEKVVEEVQETSNERRKKRKGSVDEEYGRRPKQRTGAQADHNLKRNGPPRPRKVEIIEAKPPARGRPLVWADTRQELCEGLPYFRAYHAGIYIKNDVAFGYLLDAFGSDRDFIGSHVVISHGYLSTFVYAISLMIGVENQLWIR